MAESLNNALVVEMTGTVTENYTMVRAATFMDAIVIDTDGAGAGAGTCQIGNGANAITAALNPGAANTPLRIATAGTVTAANKDLAVGDQLRFTIAGAAAAFRAYAYLYPTPGVAG